MTLDALLKKYFSVLVLICIALAAYFQASGAMELLSASFSSAGARGTLPATASALVLPPIFPKSAEPILGRNPFDSEKGPLTGQPIPSLVPPEAQAPVLLDPLTVAACEGVSARIVTESRDPLWSIAVLQGPGEPNPRMRRVGDEVADLRVEYIGFNPQAASPAVWLSKGTQLCQALLFAEEPPPAPSRPSPAAEPAAGSSGGSRLGPSKVPPEIAEKIQKVSDTEFNVDRAVVDSILEKQAELMRSARIVPEQKDGKVVGIRLFGIRPDTLLGTLGLQNGDRLEAINGFDMASPEKALEAYARLRTASKLNVKINRRGTPMSIDFHIK